MPSAASSQQPASVARPTQAFARAQAGLRWLTLMVQGQPEKTYKAGDTFQVPGGTPHDARSGPNGAKVLATYVVEKGKPLASPAP